MRISNRALGPRKHRIAQPCNECGGTGIVREYLPTSDEATIRDCPKCRSAVRRGTYATKAG